MLRLYCQYKLGLHNVGLWLINLINGFSYALLATSIGSDFSFNSGVIFDANAINNMLNVTQSAFFIVLLPLLGYFSDRLGRIYIIKYAIILTGIGYFILLLLSHIFFFLKPMIWIAFFSFNACILMISIASVYDRMSKGKAIAWISALIATDVVINLLLILLPALYPGSIPTTDVEMTTAFVDLIAMGMCYCIVKVFCDQEQEKCLTRTFLKGRISKILASSLNMFCKQRTLLIFITFFLCSLALKFIVEFFIKYNIFFSPNKNYHFYDLYLNTHLISFLSMLFFYAVLLRLVNTRLLTLLVCGILLINILLIINFPAKDEFVQALLINFILAIPMLLTNYILLTLRSCKPAHYGMALGVLYELHFLSGDILWGRNLYDYAASASLIIAGVLLAGQMALLALGFRLKTKNH